MNYQTGKLRINLDNLLSAIKPDIFNSRFLCSSHNPSSQVWLALIAEFVPVGKMVVGCMEVQLLSDMLVQDPMV